MTSSSLAPLVAAARQKRDVRPQDVIAMRLAVFDDALVSPGDVEQLVALDECVSQACPEWRAFFVEALTDFIVHQQHPRDYVDEANARWLMTHIRRDATVKRNELELLVHVLEKAVSVPAELQRFTLRQIKHAVMFGEPRNTVDADEVELLRRTVFAGASTGGIAISRQEADILFEIADAARDSVNAPSWSDFFVKAVTNLLMSANGYTAPSRDVALHRGRWPDHPEAVSLSFMAKVQATLSEGVLGHYTLAPGGDGWTTRHTIEEAIEHQAENITDEEAHWLSEHIRKDGVVAEIEKALLNHIRSEASNLHPTLQPLFEWAA